MSEVYNGDNRDGGQEIVRLIREELGPPIKGFGIFEGERIWSKLFALTFASRDHKTLLEAIACVDCAIWDVVGKATGRSVRDLLGGFTDKVPIISIGGYYIEGKTLADIGREMEAYRLAGIECRRYCQHCQLRRLRGGGVTDWRRAAALCAAAGVAMAHHEESQISQHLISAIPHGTCIECFADSERDPVCQRMWVNRPVIKDGMMTVFADQVSASNSTSV